MKTQLNIFSTPVEAAAVVGLSKTCQSASGASVASRTAAFESLALTRTCQSASDVLVASPDIAFESHALARTCQSASDVPVASLDIAFESPALARTCQSASGALVASQNVAFEGLAFTRTCQSASDVPVASLDIAFESLALARTCQSASGVSVASRTAAFESPALTRTCQSASDVLVASPDIAFESREAALTYNNQFVRAGEMPTMKSHNLIGVAMIAAFSLMTSATFAAIPWSTPGGNAGDVSYSQGASETGLFGAGGSPNALPTENTFSWNGGPAFSVLADTATQNPPDVTDAVSFFATENPTRNVTTILARLTGSYSLFGPGASASVEGTLTVSQTPPVLGGTPNMTFNIPIPINTPNADGQFLGTVAINIPSAWTSFYVLFEETISATGGPGASAYIDNQTLTIVVPEPTSIAMAAVGGAAMLLRRRRQVARV